MDGDEFRRKRESIEAVYAEISTLAENKAKEEVGKKMTKARKMLEDVKKMDLTEIQKRSTFNLKIKMDNLVHIHKLSELVR
jgi:ferredoxin-fold anticodon binding domain-containing protein